ncbi:MAG TPA: hypothetical protein VMV45_04565, partial [Casimicrobiaceae bacterium]|nr:hypothetical protein [Casimicrobiaceae bacterium]
MRSFVDATVINVTSIHNVQERALTAGVAAHAGPIPGPVRERAAGTRKPGGLHSLARTKTFMTICSFALFIAAWYGVSAWIDNRILIP